MSEPEAAAPKGGVQLGGLNIQVEPVDSPAISTIADSEIVEGVFVIEGNALVKVSLLGPVGLTPGFGEEASLRDLTDEWLRNVENALADPPEVRDQEATAGGDDGSAPTDTTPDELYGEVQPYAGEGASGFFVSARLREAGVDGRDHIVNGYFNVGGAVVMLGGVHEGESEKAILDLLGKTTWNPEGS